MSMNDTNLPERIYMDHGKAHITKGEYEISKKEWKCIHILRNPYGWDEKDVRWARIYGAELIERYHEAYENMRNYAQENGLDTTAYFGGKNDS